jgi:hypothetical protein
MTSVNCSAQVSGTNRVRIDPQNYSCQPTTNFRPLSVVAQYLPNNVIQILIGDESIFLTFSNGTWSETGYSGRANINNITGGLTNLNFYATYPNSSYNIGVSGTNPTLNLSVNYYGSSEVVIVEQPPPTWGWGYWWVWLLITIGIIVLISLFFGMAKMY